MQHVIAIVVFLNCQVKQHPSVPLKNGHVLDSIAWCLLNMLFCQCLHHPSFPTHIPFLSQHGQVCSVALFSRTENLSLLGSQRPVSWRIKTGSFNRSHKYRWPRGQIMQRATSTDILLGTCNPRGNLRDHTSISWSLRLLGYIKSLKMNSVFSPACLREHP